MALPEDDKTSWPGPADAARRLGVSRSTVHRWRVEGRLQAELVAGIWRFDPAGLDAHAGDGGDDGDDGDGDDDDGGAAAILRGGANVMATAITMARTESKHAEDLVALVTKDHRQAVLDVMNVQRDTIVTLRERLVAVEAEADQLRRQNREFLDDQRAYDLEVKRSEQSARIRELAAKDLIAFAPFFANGLAKKFGFAFDLEGALKVKSQTIPVGADGPGAGLPDALKAKLADQVLNWLATLPKTAVAKIKDVLPPDHLEVFSNLVRFVETEQAATANGGPVRT